MSIKILLADDSITIQKVIGIIFGGDEYALTVVDNGNAVCPKALETVPDILLIDALMPGMSGYEVCEQVRNTPQLANKPILLLTGSFEPFDEAKARQSGADDFIAKPFESQQIVAKVRDLYELGLSRSLVQPSAPVEPLAPQTEAAPSAAAAGGLASTPSLDDIWGAFTAPEPPSAQTAIPQPEPDPFAMFTEQAPPAAAAEQTEPAPTANASSWVPVEEHVFEFETDSPFDLSFSAPPTPPQPPAPQRPAEEFSFGDISLDEPFEPQTAAPAEPAASPYEPPLTGIVPEPTPASGVPFGEFFGASQPTEAASFAELASPPSPVDEAAVPTPENQPAPPAAASVAPTAIPALDEEQLKAALAAVSKDVIERIVWEVVPDLAENLIKEAIRRITEADRH